MRAGAMLAAVAAIGALVSSATPAGAIQASQSAARSQLDVRSGDRTAVPTAVGDARDALAQRLGIEAHVATDPVGGGVRVLDRTDGFLSGPHAGDPAGVALAYVRAHADVFGLAGADLAALRLTDRSTSNDGVTHLTWIPQSGGVPAYDSALRVAVARDGSVVAASGPPLGGLAVRSRTPQLNASQALAAAQHDVGAPVALPRAATRVGAQRVTTFANGDRASLVAFQSPAGDRLAWRVTVAGRAPYVYDEVVDASSGALLARHSLTDFAVSHADVYPYHPDAAAGGSAVQVDIAPWLSASATTLTGPNAHAYADVNDDNVAQAGEETGPSSGTDWLYPLQAVLPDSGVDCSPWSFCTWGGTGATLSSEATNRAHATTQLFYLVNTFHDWLAGAPFDFTSGSGSFDGSDPLEAQADDAIPNGPRHFVNNANMSTPPDGQSPTMQMYLWTNPFPAVNGSDDASVVFHEYTHGLSNRLIGDGGGLNDNQSGAMGEGWSDWYAMDYLVGHSYVDDTAADGDVVVGEYATGDTVHGIRDQPLDCTVGSAAAACSGSALAGHAGGFTYADLGRVSGYDSTTPAFEVHADGEIWSETLWDLRTALGAPVARRLITNAMRLSPVDPSFLDERDAILLADQTGYGGGHHDAIWQVFADRGMGYGAHTSSANATRAKASFRLPALVEGAGTTVDDPAPLGDGDGNAEPGETVSVDVTLANPGLAGLTNVHGTLSSDTAGATVAQPDAGYGAIAAGDSAQGATPFSVALGAGLACGSHVALTLHVTSDQGPLDVPVTLRLGSGRSTFSTSPGATIPDADTSNFPGAGLTSQLSVGSSGRVDDLRVTVRLTHPWTGDLQAWLTSPAGTTVELFERPGIGPDGSGFGGMSDVTFDDAAAQPIQDVPYVFYGAAISGTYEPDEPLSAFAGKDRLGTWRLRIVDTFHGDQGTLNIWSIDTDQPACSFAGGPPPPPPPSATTGAATDVTTSSATLGGSIDAHGTQTGYRFEYGTTTAYGHATATGSAGAADGAVAESVAVADLSPSTTYHFRIVALRSGVAVTTGDDGTFTTSAAPAGGGGGAGGAGTPPGGGSDGGGGGTPPGGGLSAGGGGATATGPVVEPPSAVTGKATLDARNGFRFAFAAAAGLTGNVRFTIPKHGKTKAISFGRRSFTVPQTGRVSLTTTLGGRALAQLRKRHTINVAVTISLGGTTFAETLKLSAPKPRRRHRH